jgi:hypothetical protein
MLRVMPLRKDASAFLPSSTAWGVDPVDTALVVAVISGVVALVSAAFTGWTQFHMSNRQMRREAKAALDRYRGPLLDAAWQLGERLYHIRNNKFFTLSKDTGREQDAQLTTLFRFAYYLCWRELVRTQVQLLRFKKHKDTRVAADFLGKFTWVLAADDLDEGWAMLWGDEQRGIGELMMEHPPNASPSVRGYAAFHHDYKKVFCPWMKRFADDLFSDEAKNKHRLRLLQWVLYGLVRHLDKEDAYSMGWIKDSAIEIRLHTPEESPTNYREEIELLLKEIKPP